MRTQSMAFEKSKNQNTHDSCVLHSGRNHRILTPTILGVVAATIVILAQSPTARAEVVGDAPNASTTPASSSATQINIPEGTLAQALNALAKQTGADLVYRPEQVANHKTPAISGQFTAAQAIQKLIEGTELRLSTNEAGAYLIAVPKLKELKSSSVESSDSSSNRTRRESAADSQLWVAQSIDDTASMQKVNPSPSQGEAQGEDQKESSSSEASSRSTKGIPEILVKGSKVLNTDLQRTMDDVQPFYIFDAKTIERSGARNVEDFLMQRLTMNATSGATSQRAADIRGNTSSINLRGLGLTKTLILLNGRKMAGISFMGQTNQPDINGIPLSAIDRIEVLPTSASGIYGGGAMAGAINIILKKNYAGSEVQASYRNTVDADSPARTVSGTFGRSFESGRTQLFMSGVYQDSAPLLTGDRPEIARRREAASARIGLAGINPTSPFLGSTPNIGSANRLNLTLKGSGTSLNSPIATLPAGYSASSNPSSIIAGQWNFSTPPTDQMNGLLFQVGTQDDVRIKSAAVTLRRKMSDKVELFSELMYTENRSSFRQNMVETAFIPSTAPNNPFNQDIIVSFPLITNTSFTTNSKVKVATVGALLDLPWEWSGGVDYTRSWSSFSSLDPMNSLDDEYFNDVSNGTLNFLVDTLQAPVDIVRYHAAAIYQGTSVLDDWKLRASGPLVRMPWGVATLAVALEHRREKRDDSTLSLVFPMTVINSTDTTYLAQTQTIDSVYAEANAPVISARNSIPFLNSLELQAAIRSEKYSPNPSTSLKFVYPGYSPPLTFFSAQNRVKTQYTSTNHTVGIKFKPIETVSVRASYSTAFIPPTFEQLLPNRAPNNSPVSIIDPQAGPNPYNVQTISGGNPSLTPENSKSWNAGLIWQPMSESLNGMRFALDYYRIRQFDRIGTLSPQQIIDDPAFAYRVTRSSTTGRITLVNTSFLNLTQADTSGWDMSLGYHLQTPKGTFAFTAIGTRIMNLKSQASVTSPVRDTVNWVNQGGAIKTKANATLTWERNNWVAGWSTRYYPAYPQNGSPGDPFGVSPFYPTFQGANSIASQTYHDLFASVTFEPSSLAGSSGSAFPGARILDGTTVQIGIKNVFDKFPPLDVHPRPYFYSYFGDIRLRECTLSISKRF